MTFMQYAAMYLISLPVFFALDMAWIGFVASSFYKNQIGHLLGPVNWPVAIMFYVVFLVGLLIFAIAPAVQGKGVGYALLWGALFGSFTYATYDLTNWATLREWPARVVVVDMLWGTILSASVAGATAWLASIFVVYHG